MTMDSRAKKKKKANAARWQQSQYPQTRDCRNGGQSRLTLVTQAGDPRTTKTVSIYLITGNMETIIFPTLQHSFTLQL